MSVALILPDRIITDSRMPGPPHLTIGKVFRHPRGGIFVTVGDTRLTYAFEKAMQRGEDPEPMEILEDEAFEAVYLSPTSKLIVYDENFTPASIGESWHAIGSGGEVARSWYLHHFDYGMTPEECIERVFEVRDDCGPPVVTVMLHESRKGGRRAR